MKRALLILMIAQASFANASGETNWQDERRVSAPPPQTNWPNERKVKAVKRTAKVKKNAVSVSDYIRRNSKVISSGTTAINPSVGAPDIHYYGTQYPFSGVIPIGTIGNDDINANGLIPEVVEIVTGTADALDFGTSGVSLGFDGDSRGAK